MMIQGTAIKYAQIYYNKRRYLTTRFSKEVLKLKDVNRIEALRMVISSSPYSMYLNLNLKKAEDKVTEVVMNNRKIKAKEKKIAEELLNRACDNIATNIAKQEMGWS